MDQKALRALENRCIQEEPPACTAACPIHIDVRAFVGHMARGNYPEAWKVLEKTMPFPGILGRICDAPCRNRCKRGEAGQAVEIGLLERACVVTPAHRQRILALPGKQQRIAVAGSDLDSLTAAWDLCRKGYGVTLFEFGEHPGGSLLEFSESVLPREAVTDAIRELSRLGMEIHLNASIRDTVFQAELRNSYDAVYLGLNDAAVASMEKIDGVFVRQAAMDKARSPVWLTAEGRHTATSIDRYLQNVSLTAGREREGPYPTRLYTRTDGVPSLPTVKSLNPVQGYTPDEARREAGRCLQCQCLECVKVCAYLDHFGAYPKKYAREIYNNASIVMGARQANKLINSCSLCGLCEAVCPEGFAMQTLCLDARKDMVQKGKMPPSAHEFALLDMAFSNGPQCALTRHEPGKASSAFLFFPGCQLSASAPSMVKQTYAHLQSILAGGVGLMLRCCNIPANWAGRMDQFENEMTRLHDEWRAIGSPRIVTACATCYHVLKSHLKDADILSLWRVLAENVLPADLPHRNHVVPLAVHDPCTTRHEPEIQQSVRTLLHRLKQPFEEVEPDGRFTECCGFGGLMQSANPGLAKTVVKRLSEKRSADYLTYCAGCRDNLAASGKRAVHMLDVIFPGAAGPDPGARKQPGWSVRQENRMRLKADISNELWGDNRETINDDVDMVLVIPPEVEKILEDRRILTSDIQRVIHYAEQTGEILYHPETGHSLAAFKPYNTTFWVEYSMTGSRFVLHNAYSHRMEVSGKGAP